MRTTFHLKSEDARGELNNNAKLTEDIVREIRKRWENRSPGLTKTALARELDINPSTIRDIISGRRWGHVK